MIMELALVRHRRFVIAIIVLGALLYVAISLRYIDTDHGSLGIGSDGLQYWDLSTNLLNSGEFAYSSVRRLSLHLFSALPERVDYVASEELISSRPFGRAFLWF
jgi:hypothetical protein